MRPNLPVSSAPPSQHGVVATEADLSLRAVVDALARHRWTILAVTALVIGAVGFWTWLQDPIYQSNATLLVEEDGGEADLFGQLSPMGGMMGRGRVETEILVLRSRTVAASVVDQLNLQVVLREPRGARSEVLDVVEVEDSVTRAVFSLTRNAEGRYAVELEEGRVEPGTVPPMVTPGEPVRLGGALVRLHAPGDAELPGEIVIAVLPRRAAVDALRERLSVYLVENDARVVGVAYRSPDPELAARVPDVAAAQFISLRNRLNRREVTSSVTFLREQSEIYADELREAEEALRRFREQQQIVDITAQASEQVRRLAELQAERDALRSEHSALAQLIEEASRRNASYRQLASFPTFLSNRAFQDILVQIGELETERTRLLVNRTEQDRDVRGLSTRITELEEQLFQIARNYLRSIESRIASIEANLAGFGRELEEIPAREVEFARLERRRASLTELNALLQQRLMESQILESRESTGFVLLDPAEHPREPVSPRPLRNLMLGAVIGLLLGIGTALGREALDTKVGSLEELEAAGMQVLGTIPRIQEMPASRNGAHSGNGRRALPSSGGDAASRLILSLDAHHPATEAYRALRTNIAFANFQNPPKLVVVTSAMPGDGKSITASNLAVAVAEQGTRTLLIDADLRRGVLNEVFGRPREPGLAHVLHGRTPLDAAVQSIPVGNDAALDFLPGGIFPPNPAELLGSDAMRRLLATLRERYDMVIVDAPPLNLVTDAAVLGTMVDVVVLIARTGKTDRRALQHAAHQVTRVGAPLGGVVLNDIRQNQGGYYGYYGANGYARLESGGRRKT